MSKEKRELRLVIIEKEYRHNGTYYTLGISFQTHRGKFFVPSEYSRQHGENEYDFGKRFYASNRILLKSVGSPEWRTPNTLFVRGNSLDRDNNNFSVSESDADRIFEAVDEYNITFGCYDVFPILDNDLFIVK